MRRGLLTHAALAAAALTVLAGTTAAAVPPPAPRDRSGPTSTPTATLQQELSALVAQGAASATAEIRDGGHRVWRGTSGVARLGTTAAVPANARFRIGSVTKTFVATVVMRLVAEGRVGLDDPIERWLPGIVPGGAQITVRNLLAHTSGLYDVTRSLPLKDPAAFLGIRWQTWTPQQLLALGDGHPSLFSPGTGQAYSSTDYLVLGLLIERVTGHPYGDEVAGRILRPLHLTGTSVPGTSTRIPGPHPHGYLPTPGGPVDVTDFNPSIAWSAGEMISTTADLDRFFSALLGGRLLPAAQLREMLTLPPHATDYALGVQGRTLPCTRTVYGHEGDTPGFSTWSFVTADGGRAVTISTTWGTGRAQSPDALISTALC
jgi:D-alanyl-D-alanine carboxypeptidase